MTRPPDRVTLHRSMGPHWSTAKFRGSTGHIYHSSAVTDALIEALYAAMAGRSNWTDMADAALRLTTEPRED